MTTTPTATREPSNPGRGLYEKYRVERTDGKPMGKAFVLNYTTDPHARAALAAYAESCQQDYPALSTDLRAILHGLAADELDPNDCRACNGTGTGYGPTPDGRWMETDCSACDGYGRTPRTLDTLDCAEARDGTVWEDRDGERLWYAGLTATGKHCSPSYTESHGWRTDRGNRRVNDPTGNQTRRLTAFGPYTQVLGVTAADMLTNRQFTDGNGEHVQD
ncbi:Uncharacterised protein [Mycobacteroides abscessus subsp. abscessus]|uniref:hypothetical protein n=1 Tax=Mycobacteroides abscessus TaxID=36809 RepID=UPI0009C44E68|nr:hypothetical protein [Mycobacteroides abscessus]SKO35750.1 Uncharacterised protein [Mycobacteroides abscessus subsp. abscessus]